MAFTKIGLKVISKYLPLIVVLCTSNIGILEVLLEEHCLAYSQNLLNQNIHYSEITRSSVRTLKFGNDVHIDGFSLGCPFESLKLF